MAGACLGELVRKMGDRVLRQIIPIFQAGIKEPAAATRVGVCTGLTELLENISNTQLKEHLSQLLPTIQKALVDPDADVRQVSLGHQEGREMLWGAKLSSATESSLILRCLPNL